MTAISDLLWRCSVFHRAQIHVAGATALAATALGERLRIQALTDGPLPAMVWRGQLQFSVAGDGPRVSHGPMELLGRCEDGDVTGVEDWCDRVDLDVVQVMDNRQQLHMLALSTFALRPAPGSGEHLQALCAQLAALSPEVALLTRFRLHGRRRGARKTTTAAWHSFVTEQRPLPEPTRTTLSPELLLLRAAGADGIRIHRLPAVTTMASAFAQLRDHLGHLPPAAATPEAECRTNDDDDEIIIIKKQREGGKGKGERRRRRRKKKKTRQ